MKVGLRYSDDLNPCSVRVTNTSRKGYLVSFSCTFPDRLSRFCKVLIFLNIWMLSM